MYQRILTGMSIIAVLSGCASMNQSQCVQADWRMIGAEDGSRGIASNNIGTYRKACAKHNVSPDLAEYRRGYQEGLASFCTEYMGFSKGRSGYNYSGVCPGELERDFLAGYRAGKELYEVDREIRQIRSQISHNIAKMDQNKATINDKLALIADSEALELDRITAVVDIKDLQEMQLEIEAANVSLAEDLKSMEYQLTELEVANNY